MRFYACGPVDADDAARGVYDVACARRDAWGVLCAALSIVRYVLRARAAEAGPGAGLGTSETALADAALDDEVRALSAAALLLAQRPRRSSSGPTARRRPPSRTPCARGASTSPR